MSIREWRRQRAARRADRLALRAEHSRGDGWLEYRSAAAGEHSGDVGRAPGHGPHRAGHPAGQGVGRDDRLRGVLQQGAEAVALQAAPLSASAPPAAPRIAPPSRKATNTEPPSAAPWKL